MARNASGTYSGTAAFIAGTPIISADVNAKFTDLGTEITDSLSRSGKGGMTAPLKLTAGVVANPALYFSGDADHGPYLNTAGDVRWANGGVDLFGWTSTLNTSYKPLTVAGALTASVGATITTGGLTVTAGGATVTAGGLTVSAGGLAATGTTPTANTVFSSAHSLTISGALSTTNSQTHPVASVRATTAGPNNVGLTVRTLNDASGTIAGYEDVALGLTYDVDSVVAAGGSLYIHKVAGLTITSGTTATGADPTNALTLTNGNLKLSGTQPNSDEALTNTLTPGAILKSRASLTTVGGGSTSVTINGGLSVTSASVSTGTITVTLAASVNAGASVEVTIGSNTGAQKYLAPRGTVIGSTVTIKATDLESVTAGPITDFDFQGSSSSVTLYVHVYGEQ